MKCDRCGGKGVEGFIFSLRCKPCNGTGVSGIQSVLNVDWANTIPEHIEVKDGDHRNRSLSCIDSIAITRNTPKRWLGIDQCSPLKDGICWIAVRGISTINTWSYKESIDAIYDKTGTPGIYKLSYQKEV